MCLVQNQLSVANQSLSESKAEVDKLLTQLKNQKQSEDAVMVSAKKKHATEIRVMQQKVSIIIIWMLLYVQGLLYSASRELVYVFMARAVRCKLGFECMKSCVQSLFSSS